MALTSGLALLEPITLATNGNLTSSLSWSRPATPREPAIKSAQTKCSSCSVGLSPSSSPRFAAIRSSHSTIGAPKKAWISLSQSKSLSSSSERPSNTASSKSSSKTLRNAITSLSCNMKQLCARDSFILVTGVCGYDLLRHSASGGNLSNLRWKSSQSMIAGYLETKPPHGTNDGLWVNRYHLFKKQPKL